jgi:predicted metal-dependent hydrolase
MSREVDIPTGLPKELVEESKEKKQEALNQKLAAEGAEVKKELASPEGKKFVQMIRTKLEQRAQFLIQQDPECKALLDIVDDLGYKIALSKGMAEKMMERALKR